MNKVIRWGILGTGRIAKNFSRALSVLEDAELTAVGSRSLESATQFADSQGVKTAFGSYDELVACPDIDVVYISTPHSFHKDHSILAMNAGKAVLCEKPFAMNARDVEDMIACAKANNVFLMEAMWTWFFPAIAKVLELIEGGAIGDVRLTTSEFCFRTDRDPNSRLFNPDLGGGALLDVGVYTTAFAHRIHGEAPESITALADIGETGVDEQTSVVQKYRNGAMASHTCAIRTSTENGATIYGTDGWIRIPGSFWQPKTVILSQGNTTRTFEFPLLGNGMTYEAMEVMECLRGCRKESSILPWETSLTIMTTLDRIRKCIGLTYPADQI